jgi:hypothetical protein
LNMAQAEAELRRARVRLAVANKHGRRPRGSGAAPRAPGES